MKAVIRLTFAAFGAGALMLAAAWAGVGLGPVRLPQNQQEAAAPAAAAPAARPPAQPAPGTVTLPAGSVT